MRSYISRKLPLATRTTEPTVAPASGVFTERFFASLRMTLSYCFFQQRTLSRKQTERFFVLTLLRMTACYPAGWINQRHGEGHWTIPSVAGAAPRARLGRSAAYRSSAAAL